MAHTKLHAKGLLSAGDAADGANTGNTVAPYTPWLLSQLINFVGVLRNPSTGQVASNSFQVLAGADTAPTWTGGWPKIAIIDRARRLGYTNVTGYDPVTMDVPIQFEAMVDSQPGANGAQVEINIQKLEWMAGRGRDYATTRPRVGSAAVGNPPIVTVASFNARKQQTSMIPPNLQNLSWLISGINYDTSPVRNTNGDRVRQAATVTLTQYVPLPSAHTSKTKTPDGFKTYLTGQDGNGDTVKSVCARRLNTTATQKVAEVLKFCRQRNKRFPTTSASQHLPAGTKVFVPDRLLPH